jgi:hypothetical protein
MSMHVIASYKVPSESIKLLGLEDLNVSSSQLTLGKTLGQGMFFLIIILLLLFALVVGMIIALSCSLSSLVPRPYFNL